MCILPANIDLVGFMSVNIHNYNNSPFRFFAAPSAVPSSEALFPHHLTWRPQPHPKLIGVLLPEVHRRRQNIGGLPSEGDTALLPSHFSDDL